MKRRDWIKVRKDWWESPSHRLISAAARMFGTYLLYLADGDPTWRETGVGRLVGPGGVALGSDEVSRLAQVRSRDGRRWVAELLACGTLHLDESGYLYFPNYREHQENRSAKSMRKVRKGVHSEQGCEHNVNGEEEEEAEVEEEVDLKAPQPPAGVVPPAKKRASRKKPKGSYGVDPASVEDTDTVLGWIAKARKWCGFKASALTATHANRCYVAVPMVICESSLDDWKTVINRAAAKDKDNPEMGRRYLTLSTLHRPDNFTRLMERDDLD